METLWDYQRKHMPIVPFLLNYSTWHMDTHAHTHSRICFSGGATRHIWNFLYSHLMVPESQRQ